jgi:hypothetical protein
MPTRPDPNTSFGADAGASPFAGLGGGLSFFQEWMKAASSAMPLGNQGTSAHAQWAMPTLDPQELDKRIQDLKTVQFWLEQNARMIGMTIQTLEVQRMTLSTLRGMNVPVDALQEALKAQPKANATAADAPDDGAANPLAWWNTLTTQFTQLAQQAVQAGQDVVNASQATPSGAAEPAAKKPGAKARSSAASKAKRKPTGA